jgi:hypothetical protein
MKNLLSLRRLTIAAASIVAAASIASAAQAATDTIYKYKAPKTGNFQISPLAMAPDTDGYDYYVSFPTKLRVNTGNGCFSTGVNLPQGAIITTLVVYYSSSAKDNYYVRLFRAKAGDGSFDLLADPLLSDDTGNRKTEQKPVDPVLGTVNNNQWNYSIGICLDAGNEFYGARVVYTYDNAGD